MTFLRRTYHWSARPGESNDSELSTFCHTFFGFFFLLDVVVWCLGWGNGAPRSACPSLSCCIMKRCSSLSLNLKNMSSFPTRKRISPLPTSILALADLRKGRPSTRSTLKSPLYSLPQSWQGRMSLALTLGYFQLSRRDIERMNLRAA